MSVVDTYYSIQSASQGLFKDKGSRFIAYAYQVTSEDEVKPLVDALKKEHHSARHHCFAYRIGYDGGVWRANDDGEPSGSAGRPILGVIDSLELSDVLVVVVRYFGGVLLGVPGLIRAYKEATADALKAAGRIQKTALERYELLFDYEQMNQVQRIVKSFPRINVVGQAFDLMCEMTLEVPLGSTADLLETINKTNNEKRTRIQCRPLQASAAGN